MNLGFFHEEKLTAFNSTVYRVKNNSSKIEIMSAKLNRTSFNITFAVDRKYEDEKTFVEEEMEPIDENGKLYEFTGYSMDLKEKGKFIGSLLLFQQAGGIIGSLIGGAYYKKIYIKLKGV